MSEWVSPAPAVMYGEVKSPLYPQPYPAGVYEERDLIVPTGYRIQLTFTHLDIEPSDDCYYDSLMVSTWACGHLLLPGSLNGVTYFLLFSIKKKQTREVSSPSKTLLKHLITENLSRRAIQKRKKTPLTQPDVIDLISDKRRRKREKLKNFFFTLK